MMDELDDRILQTKTKLMCLEGFLKRDQAGYYAARQEDIFTILSNQLVIMERLKEMGKKKGLFAWLKSKPVSVLPSKLVTLNEKPGATEIKN